MDSYFLWDNGQLLAEFDSAGKRRADYAYSPGVDEPFAETLGDSTPVATRYHQQDALGNVIGTIAGGDSSQTASYDSWGVPSLSGNADNRLLWKGLMWEGDVVSLYYARNRWYDPEMGRFVSEDPIGHEGGDNLYAFARNDPIDGSDPSGFGGIPDCGSGIAARWVVTGPNEGHWWCSKPMETVKVTANWDPCSDEAAASNAPSLVLAALCTSRKMQPLNDAANGFGNNPFVQLAVAFAGGPVGEAGEAVEAANALRFTKDQNAIIQLGKEAFKRRGGFTKGEWSVLEEWAKEYGLSPARLDFHPWKLNIPHIHLGPLSHIPLLP